MTPQDLTSPASTDLLALRREDLDLLLTSCKQEMRSKKQWAGVVAAIGGLALGPILISIGEYAGWPAALAPLFFGLGWVLFLGMGAVVVVRARRTRARYQIRCPECDVSLLGPRLKLGDFTYAELAIKTGCCPSCGVQVLAP